MAGLSVVTSCMAQTTVTISIRRLLEDIYIGYEGDRGKVGWQAFEVYLKRIWFSNGIHHHYANTKHLPEFSEAYFDHFLAETARRCGVARCGVRSQCGSQKSGARWHQGRGKFCSEPHVPDVTTDRPRPTSRASWTRAAKPCGEGLNSRLEKDAEGQVYENV